MELRGLLREVQEVLAEFLGLILLVLFWPWEVQVVPEHLQIVQLRQEHQQLQQAMLEAAQTTMEEVGVQGVHLEHPAVVVVVAAAAYLQAIMHQE